MEKRRERGGWKEGKKEGKRERIVLIGFWYLLPSSSLFI